MRQNFEAILRWLQSSLGSSHPIVALYGATQNFVANLLQQPFVPRLSAVSQLENFVNSRSCGSVLVYAPAGFGKTTLVTNWTFSTGDWALAMHFFSRAPEFFGLASNPSVAFAHLLAQIFAISEIQGFKLEGESPDEPKFSIPETQNERASLLCETIANLKLPSDRKLIILLDGIDEADEPFPSPFPDQLPEGVFVVVSARWDGQSEMPYLRGWKFDERIELSLMDESEIAEWLKCYGSGELKAMSEDEKIVATLKQATDGFPLFLRFILDELAEKVKLGEMVSAFEVPKGFSAYICEQVQRIVASSWDGVPLVDLVALLSVAKGAIRQDEIAQVLNMPFQVLSHLPNIVARWLRISRVSLSAALPLAGDGSPKRPSGTSPDATEGLLSFTFAHPLLATEFAKAMGEKAKEVEARLIAWCEKWREHKSNYALRYFDEHLKSVGEFEKLWALAMDDEWLKIHNEVFPDEPELPLKAVRNGLEAAIERENPVMMAKMLLRHVELLGRLESLMEALRRGKTERALRLAGLLMEQDVSMGTLWHLILAWVWHQRGEIENAITALRQLLRTYREEILSRQYSVFRSYLLEPLQDLPEALEAAKLVLSDNDKGNLALKLAEERKWEHALELAKSVRYLTVQLKALSGIAAEMARTGKVEEANRLFAEVKQRAMAEKEGWGLSFALTELLNALWKAGWEQEADRIVNEAIKIVQRRKAETSVLVLTKLAKLLTGKGKWEQAEKCTQLAKKRVGKIENAEQRCMAMGEMAQVWTQMGRKQEAEETVEQIVIGGFARICDYCFANCLCDIADEAAKVGWRDWAKSLTQKAMDIAESIADKHERGLVFHNVAKVLTKVGSLEDVKLLAETREDSWERSNAWQGIVEGLIELGRYKEATEIADKIENLWHRTDILIASAKAAAMKGDKETAKQIFERAKSAQWRLLEIAVAQAEVGLMEEALVTAEEALAFWQKERQSARWIALRMIAKILAKQGQVENAELVVKAVKNAWEKAQALKELAFAYMSLGQKEKAEVALRQIVGLAEAMIGDGACPYDRGEFFGAIFSQALKTGWHEATDIVLSEFASVHLSLFDEFKGIASKIAAEEGQLGKALEIAQSITDPDERAWALIAVARAFMKAGEKEQARQIVEEVWLSEQVREVASFRCEVVKLLAQLGEWETVMQRLESISDYFWLSAVKFLAKEAARQGNVALAAQIASKLQQTDLKAEIWTDLVEVFAETGNEAEARKAFEKAKKLAMESDERDEKLTYLASAVAELGWIEEARGLIEAIEDERGIGIVASSLALRNKPELAEIFAAESDRASAWVWVGEAWAKIGQMGKAKSAFERAVSLAKGNELEKIAGSMIMVGFADEGVSLLEGRRLSGWTLWNVLINLAEQGSRRNFLKLLPQCRWNAELAYQACGWLAKLYPEQAMEIAGVLSEDGRSKC